jgi:hypothetical protein
LPESRTQLPAEW